MVFHTQIKALKRYLCCMGAVYALAALFLFFIIDGKIALVRRLNVLANEAFYPVFLSQGQKEYNLVKLRTALRYYKTEGAFSLWRADELAAYCYFELKDYSRSKAMYIRALQQAPQRFWLAFNAGTTAYRQGHCNEAKDFFLQIITGAAQQQREQAVLFSLKKLSPEIQQQLLIMVPAFVDQVRIKSEALLAHCNSEEAAEQDPDLFKPVMHPWSFIVIPGQESFFEQ